MNYIISEKEVKRLEADLNKQLNINLYDSSALLKLTKYYCIHNDYRKASNFLLLCDQLGLDDDYFNYYRLLTFYKTICKVNFLKLDKNHQVYFISLIHKFLK